MRARSVAFLALCVMCLPARADDWPGFRGPGGSGVSSESKLPTDWSTSKNVEWKLKVPGVAWSSPVVVGDKVFVTTAITEKQTKPRPFGGFGGFGGGGGGGRPGGGRPGGGFGGGFGGGRAPDVVYRWEVHCIDRNNGKVLWKELAAEKKPAISATMGNSYASETPITDGERVYAYFGTNGGVYCFDLKGKKLWNKDLGSYQMQFGWGTGSSPVLEGDRLFIQCDNEKKSFLVALDKKNGKELWRAERSERSTWSTPFVWKNKKRTEIVACGSRRAISYDPATGKVLWELGGMSGSASASPVADDERIYFGCGMGGGMMGGGNSPLFAVKAGASGDITLKSGTTSNDGVAWSRTRSGPYIVSPLLYKGYLYVAEQRGGMLSCYDAKTGKPAYSRERLQGARSFTSSPWAYDDKIFCLDEDGKTFVVQAGPEFKLLGKNELNEMFWSSPAIAGGALFLRGVDTLYCIRQK
ncbi:MAG TPA: PQQ-binding-like beta-propeller repeat protein [Gemmataceae bacterium]|nr:PQQ-binding-like beta-propeller repeat protein [Gemmataceae bacterium]